MEQGSEDKHTKDVLSLSDFKSGSNSSKEFTAEKSKFSSVRDSFDVLKASSSKTSCFKNPVANNTLGLSNTEHELGLGNSQSGDNISKKTLSKTVSFRYSDELIPDEFQISRDDYDELTTEQVPIINNDLPLSIPFPNSEKSEMLSKRSVLENIPEIDENLLDENPGYVDWDRYEAGFKDSLKKEDSLTLIPRCIPPWAKTFRQAYGMSYSESTENLGESQQTMKEKLESLMKKHKELMLVKRVESKKQVLIEPSKLSDKLDTVKMQAKNTKFYVAPLTKERQKTSSSRLELPVADRESSQLSIPQLSDSEISLTKKTSKTKAKRELSSILNSIEKAPYKSQNVTKIDSNYKKDSRKCQKITLSDVREFVNMSPDERKLHQIIKIEKVPSVKEITGSKTRNEKAQEPRYIINIPKCEITDRPTLDTIKIKEKRKLRVESIENIEERVTELRYNQGFVQKSSRTRNHDLRSRNEVYDEVGRSIKTKLKSPTETKTFQVQSQKTPIVRPLIDRKENTDKVLLIQYDKKSKRESEKGDVSVATQILGVKKNVKGNDEMYLYGSGTDGKETASKVEEIPSTLKKKVNMIFEEIRQMTFKPQGTTETSTSAVQVCPSISSKTTQRPSDKVGTDVAMVQAVPDVKSAQIQTTAQSQLSTLKSKTTRDSFITVPYTTPEDRAETVQSTIDEKRLEKLLNDLALEEKTDLEENTTDDRKRKPMKSVVSLKDEQDFTKIVESIQPLEQEVEDFQKIEGEMSPDKEKVTSSVITERSKEHSKVDVVAMENSMIDNEKLESQDSLEEVKSVHGSQIMNLKDDKRVKRTSKPEFSSQESLVNKIKSQLNPETRQTSSLLLKDKKSTEKKPTLKESAFAKNESIRKVSDTGSDVADVERISRESDASKVSFALENDEITYFRSKRIEDDDIRSYELSPEQGKELNIKSSSKFLDSKGAIRKKMNWTDDTIYLENNTCPQLLQGLAELGLVQPPDPISYLANWIYKQHENREHQERDEVFTEHLELARTMLEVDSRGTGNIQPPKKFNLKRYPLRDKSQVVSGRASLTKNIEEFNLQEETVKSSFSGHPKNSKLESEIQFA